MLVLEVALLAEQVLDVVIVAGQLFLVHLIAEGGLSTIFELADLVEEGGHLQEWVLRFLKYRPDLFVVLFDFLAAVISPLSPSVFPSSEGTLARCEPIFSFILCDDELFISTIFIGFMLSRRSTQFRSRNLIVLGEQSLREHFVSILWLIFLCGYRKSTRTLIRFPVVLGVLLEPWSFTTGRRRLCGTLDVHHAGQHLW